MHDLVIKGGTVVDGTGAPARTADVAITDGIVTEVGRVNELARETLDADGALVTPGFVDVHTHFDGQVTWDPLLTPTCWHGVTTVVMGNCGVGFAPVQHDRHEWLIGLMEGVEDIPGRRAVGGDRVGVGDLPEYLDAIERKPLLFDVGTQVPHGAVRAYVMGERGAKNEPATAADIEQMAELVRLGIEAGALGFSTSRTIAHMAIDGEPVPGTFAAHDELFGIGACSASSAPACSSSRRRARSAKTSPRPSARWSGCASSRPRSAGRSRSRSRRTTTIPSRGRACSSCAPRPRPTARR